MRKFLRRNSISKKLAAFLSVMLTLQCALFAAFLLLGGTLDQLDQNAMTNFCDRVSTRKGYLENDMVQRWSNLDRSRETLDAEISRFLSEQALTTADLTPNQPKMALLLYQLMPELIALMRNNAVTGSFVIFHGNSPVVRPNPGEAYIQSGLYLRDMDPTSNPTDDSDIMVERGSADLFRMISLPMDVNWKPSFALEREDNAYFRPMQAARTGRWSTAAEMGYWCGAFQLTGDNVPVVTYTQPLLDGAGQPYGVVGVELSADYLYRQIPSAELSADKSGAYLLAVGSKAGGPYLVSSANGGTARRAMDERLCYLDPLEVFPSIYEVDNKYTQASDKIYASVQPLNLYNGDSPYPGERWVLIGLIECATLLSVSTSIAQGILWLALFTVAVGIALSILAGHLFTRPVRALANYVRHQDPNAPIALPQINIREIDELSASIERLSCDVSDASSRMSRIIELSNIPLAAFEYGSQLEHPLYTKNLFPLLGLNEPAVPPSTEAFQALLSGLAPYLEAEEGEISLFRLPNAKSGFVWLRLQSTERDGSTLGVLTDVTAEEVEKRRLEYERDYDLLTNLLNRRSFQTRIARLERQPEGLKTAAMLMMDLDNLKYLNDTYGHECGDQYIRCAADVLRGFTVVGGLAARISGDEFYLFLSGYEDRAALEQVLQRLQTAMAEACILLPNGQPHRLRASTGIAWYPDDSPSLSELVRFADFAMYEAKTGIKGGSRNFNLTSYRRDAFLLYSREELNRILDERAVDYAFQPLVSCVDGSVMGYEALMRPRSKALSSPMDVLRIARAQSKLSHIEKLTWFRALECFTAIDPGNTSCALFVNSVSSQVLSPGDMERFLTAFSPYLERLVIEFTESDEMDTEATETKQHTCRQHGIQLALDDFGTGYSNDSVLLTLRPNFVKADMSIIRGIDHDKTRQTMLRNLTTLCHDLQIKVIAEGVETSAELRAVIGLGADFIQGYYTGKPALALTTVDPAVAAEIRGVSLP